MVWLTKQPEIREGEERGAYGGRNRKKLKHRRLDAVEVQARKLEERGVERADGSFDEEGVMKLLEAQADKDIAQEQGFGGSAPMRQWTMEDLDREFPTEEGNRRLGVEEDEEGPTRLVGVKQRERWERGSHFVEMRKPGARPLSLLPDEAVNYTPQSEQMVVFVEGSTGVRYAVECHEFDTVASFKERVWDLEREYRYAEGSSRRNRDKAQGFRIEEQNIFFGDGELFPDSVTLKLLNVTEGSLMLVVPKKVPPSKEDLEDLERSFADACWTREMEQDFAAESDSEEERDSDYREWKEAHLAAGDQTLEAMKELFPGLAQTHDEMRRSMPNAGSIPHFNMTAEWVDAQLERIGNASQQVFYEGWQRWKNEFDEMVGGRPVVTREMHEAEPIEVDEGFLAQLLAQRQETGLPLIHVMRQEGDNYSYVGGDAYAPDSSSDDGFDGGGEGDGEGGGEREGGEGEGGGQDGVRRGSTKGERLSFEEEVRNLDRQEPATFSLPEALMEEVKENWRSTYGGAGGAKRGVGNGGVGGRGDSEGESDDGELSPIKFDDA